MNDISPFAKKKKLKKKLENLLFPKTLEFDNLFLNAPVQVVALRKLYCRFTPTISFAAHDTALETKVALKREGNIATNSSVSVS